MELFRPQCIYGFVSVYVSERERRGHRIDMCEREREREREREEEGDGEREIVGRKKWLT